MRATWVRPLVERCRRQLVLTAAGARLVPEARELVARTAAQGQERRLVVAASPLLASTSVPRLLRRGLAIMPDTDLVVRVARSEELSRIVREGKADVAWPRLPATPGLDDLVFEREPVVPVAGDSGREAEAAPAAIGDVLPRLPQLIDTHAGYWPALLGLLGRCRLVGRTLPVMDTAAAKRLVEEGLGVSRSFRSAPSVTSFGRDV